MIVFSVCVIQDCVLRVMDAGLCSRIVSDVIQDCVLG